MSDVAQSIQDHSNGTWDGDLVTDWIVITATIDSDGVHGIGLIPSRDPMPGYVLKGLLTDALDKARDGLFEFDGDDDDD